MPKHPLKILLEDIRSALNVGAIFRTSDAVGVEELILCGITPYPPHSRIPKTALGASEHVPWRYVQDVTTEIEEQRAKGYTIIGIEVSSESNNIFNYSFPPKSLLIFGNEINGVSAQILKRCDKILKLPMYGVKESLNVATTVGIAAYEVIRQWNFRS